MTKAIQITAGVFPDESGQWWIVTHIVIGRDSRTWMEAVQE